MIVHLCSDETFIDNCIIDVFNRLHQNKNTYIVISENKDLVYVKQKGQVTHLHPNDDKILNLCNQSSAVIVHLMNQDKAFWVAKIKKEVTILWYCWGIDFYNLGEFEISNFSIYEHFTKKSFDKIYYNTFLKKIKHHLSFIRFIYFRLKRNFPLFYNTLDKAFNRVDFVSTIVPPEYALIKKTLPLKNSAIYLDFKYGSMEMLLGIFYNKEFDLGSKILIGNSCALTNNHLDAFAHLKKLNVTSQIICPLSYGNFNNGEIIEKKGNQLFADNFEALKNYLPLEEYVKITTSCCVMIMNNKRQEAVGNILLGLYLGMRVFLNCKSPVYNYFKEQGIIVFDFYFDFKNTPNCLSPLTTNERNQNRAILEKLWGKETVEQQILTVISMLTHKTKNNFPD